MTSAITSEVTPHEHFDPAIALNRLPLSASIVDSWIITKRNLKKLKRIPQMIIFSTIQPVMFVLLFRYVFGGSISFGIGPNGHAIRYVDYLIPGIMVQVITFGASAAAVGMSADFQSGIIDRFRSLPMSRGAVLAGRTIADCVRHLFVVLLMIGVGSIVGFRFHNGFVPALAAIGLCVAFGFAMAWVFVYVGMIIKDPETAQIAGFVPSFPLIFLSGAFSPTKGLPKVLQAFARNQPLGHVVNSLRGLTQGGPVAHSIIMMTAWMVGIVVVFSTLSIRKYRSGN